MLRVPEERREVRHQMRTRLAWAGFGSLGGGLWITPHAEREHELPTSRAPARPPSSSASAPSSARSATRERSSPRRGTSTRVADAYRAFIARFGRLRPKAPEAVFRAQTLLVHEWRKFPFLDPDLPEDMLPARWPRERAHDVFPERHAPWHGAGAGLLRLARDVSIVAFWAPNLC